MRRTFLYGLMTALLVAGATRRRARRAARRRWSPTSPAAVRRRPFNTGAYGKAIITINPGAGEVTWVIDVFNFPTGLPHRTSMSARPGRPAR